MQLQNLIRHNGYRSRDPLVDLRGYRALKTNKQKKCIRWNKYNRNVFAGLAKEFIPHENVQKIPGQSVYKIIKYRGGGKKKKKKSCKF